MFAATLAKTLMVFPVTGAVPWEIFAYSSMLWRKHTADKAVQTPYQLDGLIYQALNQDYNTSMKESKLLDYKWKPQDKNSIDFYITFERDRITNKVLTVYDNSVDEHMPIQSVCRLNNRMMHRVENRSSTYRVHLIVDVELDGGNNIF